MLLDDFLLKNQDEILAKTEKNSRELAGDRPSSAQLKQGLLVFYEQLIERLREERLNPQGAVEKVKKINKVAEAKAATEEVKMAKSAGLYGQELQRLGYTLSHVVHAYGAMCQSITEFATMKNVAISNTEFHSMNRCLDAAIAGAVTEYQAFENTQDKSRAYEMRSALTSVSISFQLIKRGTVGLGGSTGQVLERNLKRLEELIDQSLSE